MNKTTKVCMVVYSYYPNDSRVRREAEGLEEEGIFVDIISLRKKTELSKEKLNNINVYRINVHKKRGTKLHYIWQWSYFLVASLIKLSWLQIINRYQVIHVHNMPDFLIFSAILPKILKKKIILDLHDPMPELYMTKYKIPEKSFLIKVLKKIEKLSIKFADIVITPNISFRELFISRGCKPNKIKIIMNSPQEKIFRSSDLNLTCKTKIKKTEYNIMYHGYIAEHNGLDIAIDAISCAREKIPNIIFSIYGGGNFLPKVKKQIKNLDLENIVKIYGTVSIERIAQAIRFADIGIIPNRKTPFTNLNLPTRIFEYLVIEKPVIVPKTQGIYDYFNEESIIYFKPGDPEDLADKIMKYYFKSINHEKVVNNGINVYKKYKWKYQQKELLNIVNLIVGTPQNMIH